MGFRSIRTKMHWVSGLPPLTYLAAADPSGPHSGYSSLLELLGSVERLPREPWAARRAGTLGQTLGVMGWGGSGTVPRAVEL